MALYTVGLDTVVNISKDIERGTTVSSLNNPLLLYAPLQVSDLSTSLPIALAGIDTVRQAPVDATIPNDYRWDVGKNAVIDFQFNVRQVPNSRNLLSPIMTVDYYENTPLFYGHPLQLEDDATNVSVTILDSLKQPLKNVPFRVRSVVSIYFVTNSLKNTYNKDGTYSIYYIRATYTVSGMQKVVDEPLANEELGPLPFGGFVYVS